jgi:hypothetical protein
MGFEGSHVLDNLLVHDLFRLDFLANQHSEHFNIEFDLIGDNNLSVFGSFEEINEGKLDMGEILFLESDVLVVEFVGFMGLLFQQGNRLFGLDEVAHELLLFLEELLDLVGGFVEVGLQ